MPMLLAKRSGLELAMTVTLEAVTIGICTAVAPALAISVYWSMAGIDMAAREHLLFAGLAVVTPTLPVIALAVVIGYLASKLQICRNISWLIVFHLVAVALVSGTTHLLLVNDRLNWNWSIAGVHFASVAPLSMIAAFATTVVHRMVRRPDHG